MPMAMEVPVLVMVLMPMPIAIRRAGRLTGRRRAAPA
jgi:hypothetical protein